MRCARKVFSKLAREITVAAKMGMPDPDMNPRLRAAILAARAENMPKDNIQRAINKAAGGDGENYDEIRYEGYGPGGVALIVEAMTDNRNRTASDIRSSFTKSGGNLAETGAVSLHVRPCRPRRVRPGRRRCRHHARRRHRGGRRRRGRRPRTATRSIAPATALNEVDQGAGRKIRRAEGLQAGLEAADARSLVDDEAGEKLMRLMETLEEHDDVQNVYGNFELSEALMQKMSE